MTSHVNISQIKDNDVETIYNQYLDDYNDADTCEI